MKINLPCKFYNKKAIEKAKIIFSNSCDCKIINNLFEVEIISNMGDEQIIAEEFSNFVLGLMKEDNLF